ncbi:hypothetical protein [Sphingobium sp. ba1]|uniref:hypothetical protein n=1 Tax=Sphingobium sp. ba1 TaxID=1522072 RepID=UPI00138DF0C6|nr:hypothetical protein [Sphingobium sp. ba1]
MGDDHDLAAATANLFEHIAQNDPGAVIRHDKRAAGFNQHDRAAECGDLCKARHGNDAIHHGVDAFEEIAWKDERDVAERHYRTSIGLKRRT